MKLRYRMGFAIILALALDMILIGQSVAFDFPIPGEENGGGGPPDDWFCLGPLTAATHIQPGGVFPIGHYEPGFYFVLIGACDQYGNPPTTWTTYGPYQLEGGHNYEAEISHSFGMHKDTASIAYYDTFPGMSRVYAENTLLSDWMAIRLVPTTTLGSTGPDSDVVEWPISAGGNGHYYEAVLVPSRITWDDAKAAAEAKNGHLVTITSEAENEFVYNLVAGDDRYWWMNSYNQGHGPLIGGYQPDGSPEPAGGWTWVTGEPFSYTNWAAGQPENFNHNEVVDGLYIKGTENALEFFDYGTLKPKKWNDLPHDWAGDKGYIIEWEGSYSQ